MEEPKVENCENYLTSYLQLDGKYNNVEQIRRLQKFLKEKEGFENIRNTGIFGQQTHNAVVKFQEKYADEILKPWKLSRGTGWVYKTTIKKINELYCEK